MAERMTPVLGHRRRGRHRTMTTTPTDAPDGQETDEWTDTGTDRVDELRRLVESLRHESDPSPETLRQIDVLLDSLRVDLEAVAAKEGIDLDGDRDE